MYLVPITSTNISTSITWQYPDQSMLAVPGMRGYLHLIVPLQYADNSGLFDFNLCRVSIMSRG